MFHFDGFKAQQCSPAYYLFGFLDTYLNDLDKALNSTSTAVNAVEDNKYLLEEKILAMS